MPGFFKILLGPLVMPNRPKLAILAQKTSLIFFFFFFFVFFFFFFFFLFFLFILIVLNGHSFINLLKPVHGT